MIAAAFFVCAHSESTDLGGYGGDANLVVEEGLWEIQREREEREHLPT